MWLMVTYLLHTWGELALSPVGLSAMTKLAPARIVGLMMGVWFLSISVGNFTGGRVVDVLRQHVAADALRRRSPRPAIVGGVVHVRCWPRPIKRLMGGK